MNDKYMDKLIKINNEVRVALESQSQSIDREFYVSRLQDKVSRLVGYIEALELNHSKY